MLIAKNKKLELTKNEWNKIEEFIEVFKPLKITTIKLQDSQMSFGDFYIIWINLKLNMQQFQNNLGKKVYENLEIREKMLLRNDTVYAAMFLDPRIRGLLSLENKELAILHLKKVTKKWDQYLKSSSQNMPIDDVETSSSAASDELEGSPNTSISSNSSLLDNYLQSIEIENNNNDENSLDDEDGQIDLITKYREIELYKPKRISPDEHIFPYWETERYKRPHLYNLAMIIHGVPGTQISVERAFSALKLILSDLRYNLSSENLAKLIIVKLNHEF